jgi:hypothetical protein
MSNYKLKRTTEEAADYFAKHGCKLIGEYQGAMTKMEYICSCGEKGNTSWNNFTKGKRCGKCKKWGLAHKKSLKEIKKIFEERNCEFLDDWYGGIHTKHKYRCICGGIAEISFAGFYYQNQNCRDCGLEKNKKENHHMWRMDRLKFESDKLFRKKMYKALRSTLLSFGKQKGGKTFDMLGYSPKELKEHICNHPNWKNAKDTNWHLDHIFPIQAFLDFNIYAPNIINALDNLQPLEGKQNISKNAKYDKIEFVKWLQTKQIFVEFEK